MFAEPEACVANMSRQVEEVREGQSKRDKHSGGGRTERSVPGGGGVTAQGLAQGRSFGVGVNQKC